MGEGVTGALALFGAFQEHFSFTSAVFCEHATPMPGPTGTHLRRKFSEHWALELILITDAKVWSCLLAR